MKSTPFFNSSFTGASINATKEYSNQVSTYRHRFQAFPFHLVEQSPWPIVTSLTLFTMAISAVLYFHGFPFGGEILLLGFILTCSAMALWFRDVILEGTYLGDHTSQVQNGLNLGVILFIVSEVMAFFSVF